MVYMLIGYDKDGFNEAEAIKPRNRRRHARQHRISRASMRPRQSSLGIYGRLGHNI